jgi:hypothetical protein
MKGSKMTHTQMVTFVEVQCLLTEAKEMWDAGNMDKTFEEFLQIALDAIKVDATLEQ